MDLVDKLKLSLPTSNEHPDGKENTAWIHAEFSQYVSSTHPTPKYLQKVLAIANLASPKRTYPAWWKREVLRVLTGVYKTTEALEWLTLEGYLGVSLIPHISEKDPNLVAYTPSTIEGERDKQILTTFGRLLRKTCALWTDEFIADKEASHRAETTGTYTLATDREEIEYIFRNLQGSSTCMGHASSHWGLHDDLHPSHAYAAPGFAIAYIRAQDEDKVTSRAIVWQNPDNPTDKRFVRVYGDQLLQRMLARDGYQLKSFEGAKLRKLPVPDSPDRFVLPYLDGVDGVQSYEEGSYVANFGTDYLTILTKEQRNTVAALDGISARIKNHTSVIYYLPPVPSSEWRCALTNTAYSVLDDRPFPIILNGEVVNTHRTAVAERWPHQSRGLYVAYGSRTIWAPEYGDPCPTFDYFGSLHVDNAATRLLRDFVWLETSEVPNGVWALKSEVETIHPPNGEPIKRVVPCENRGRALNEEENSAPFLIDLRDAPAWRKLGYVKCANIGERPTIIHTRRPTLRKTEGGTYFDVKLHESRFVQLLLEPNQPWVKRSGTQRVQIFTESLTYRGSFDLPTAYRVALPLTAVGRFIKAMSENETITEETRGVVHRRVVNLLRETMSHIGLYAMPEGADSPSPLPSLRYSTPPTPKLEDLRRAAQYFRTHSVELAFIELMDVVGEWLTAQGLI